MPITRKQKNRTARRKARQQRAYEKYGKLVLHSYEHTVYPRPSVLIPFDRMWERIPQQAKQKIVERYR